MPRVAFGASFNQLCFKQLAFHQIWPQYENQNTNWCSSFADNVINKCQSFALRNFLQQSIILLLLKEVKDT